jgi:ATP-dependent helicase/nuclease subunit B
MYDWLSDSLGGDGTVVTANRRLSRDLSETFSVAQLNAGRKAWRSPEIYAWQDWLLSLSDRAIDQEYLPGRINARQSQLLWERCLKREINDSESGISSLVRMSRETWQRLADWQISIGEVARATQSEDQKLFASVAGRYLGLLERENWVDDAGLGELVLRLITDRKIRFAGSVTFAGFERQRPIIVAISDAMITAGYAVGFAPVEASADSCTLQSFENDAAEYRSAGAWAREQVVKNLDARIAIIANGLDNDAEAIARQVREGATPGWQHGHHSLHDAVNVSYGQRLSDYPAISIAVLLLRWLVGDLPSADVGLLLRSPLLGTAAVAGRSRLELHLRQLPDRSWSPSMITAELRGKDAAADAGAWLAQLAAFGKRRRDLPRTASPAEWVVLVDDTLKVFGWPGATALNSVEFQLINRWRELLNEFARLALVSSKMGPGAAIARLDSMASEVIFQPEARNAQIQLMGPLEASGMQFDALWITGVTTTHWPSAGAPSALVSRRLQVEHGMPDSTPGDTLFYAEQMLTRLVASGINVVCSYALTVEDAEQTASDLLMPLVSKVETPSVTPDWYATSLTDRADLAQAEDRIPAVAAGEKISGGAGTIQRQLSDPISAFVHGRMGARVIYPQAVGIPAPMRGNLIHDALYKLYIDLPSSELIREWKGEDLADRIDAALNFAFARHERNTDAVLQQLLFLERRRISELLREFVAIDASRGEFQISNVEGVFEFVAGHVRLPLRFDRIDTLSDNGIAILDYKTGSKKQLINRNGEAQEIQLFVYASATDAAVSALALVNVDAREISFHGAGIGYTDTEEWPELLQRVKNQISVACSEIASGDVRINIEQGMKAARPLNLLSRYTELRHDSG